jgi:hypothetical protein
MAMPVISPLSGRKMVAPGTSLGFQCDCVPTARLSGRKKQKFIPAKPHSNPAPNRVDRQGSLASFTRFARVTLNAIQ